MIYGKTTKNPARDCVCGNPRHVPIRRVGLGGHVGYYCPSIPPSKPLAATRTAA